jgi:RimJ/RimL family protein N-acetyltransferase
VRLRGVRDDDVPTLARWEMDPGRLITLSNWVAPPSAAAAKERIAKRSANEKDDLGFAIETLDDPPVLVGRIWLSAAGTRPKDRCATVGSPSVVSTSVVATARTRCGSSSATGSARWVCTAFSSAWLGSTPPGSAPTRRRGSSRRARYRESVLHDGRWYDAVLMSILDHEWAARRSPTR